VGAEGPLARVELACTGREGAVVVTGEASFLLAGPATEGAA
jgi:hypothetical protein